jgi:hypothetical protein
MKKQFTKKLAAATDEVSAAEKTLAGAIRLIGITRRAEKETISRAVEEALTQLKAARKNLLDLQKLALKDD